MVVAYSFRPQFIDAILSGRKRQTMRAARHGAVGHVVKTQALQLYTGMRTKQCRLILRTHCTAVSSVRLRWSPVIEFMVGERRLSVEEMQAMAVADGFADLREMEAFWAKFHPGSPTFSGVLIEWHPPAGPVEMGSSVELAGAAA